MKIPEYKAILYLSVTPKTKQYILLLYTWGSSKSSIIRNPCSFFKLVEWLACEPHLLGTLYSVGDLCGWRGIMLYFFLSLQRERCFLRAWRGLLSFYWAIGNHVWGTLAEMTLLWLRRQLALFCMVVKTSAIVAPEKQMIESFLKQNMTLKAWYYQCNMIMLIRLLLYRAFFYLFTHLLYESQIVLR